MIQKYQVKQKDIYILRFYDIITNVVAEIINLREKKGCYQMKKNVCMNVKRGRKSGGTSVWTVNFKTKLLDKLMKKIGKTYNPVEIFEVGMRVKANSKGYVKSLTTGKTVDYSVVYDDKPGDMVLISFNIESGPESGRDFVYNKKKSRGYGTGVFYQFFNDLVRDGEMLATVNDGKKVEDTEDKESKVELKTNAEEEVVDTAEESDDDSIDEEENVDPDDPVDEDEDYPEEGPTEEELKDIDDEDQDIDILDEEE